MAHSVDLSWLPSDEHPPPGFPTTPGTSRKPAASAGATWLAGIRATPVPARGQDSRAMHSTLAGSRLSVLPVLPFAPPMRFSPAGTSLVWPRTNRTDTNRRRVIVRYHVPSVATLLRGSLASAAPPPSSAGRHLAAAAAASASRSCSRPQQRVAALTRVRSSSSSSSSTTGEHGENTAAPSEGWPRSG